MPSLPEMDVAMMEASAGDKDPYEAQLQQEKARKVVSAQSLLEKAQGDKKVIKGNVAKRGKGRGKGGKGRGRGKSAPAEEVSQAAVASAPAQGVSEAAVASAPAEGPHEAAVASAPAERVPQAAVASAPAEGPHEAAVASAPAEGVPQAVVASAPAEGLPQAAVASAPAEGLPQAAAEVADQGEDGTAKPKYSRPVLTAEQMKQLWLEKESWKKICTVCCCSTNCKHTCLFLFYYSGSFCIV